MCLPYVVFGSVIWAAYVELGEQSLLVRGALVAADGTPAKLVPGALPRGVAFGPPVNHRPASAASEVERPTAASFDADRQMPAETLVGAEQPAQTALESSAPAKTDSMMAPAAPPEPMAATPRSPAEEQALAATRGPVPKPSFKPLGAIEVAAAEATPARERTDAAWLGVRRTSTPTPSLKPAMMPSRQPTGPAREDETRQVAAAPTFPDALRAWWSNLKILLAAGPAPRAIRARGGDDSDRGAARGAVDTAGLGRQRDDSGDRNGAGAAANDGGSTGDAGATGGGAGGGGASAGGGSTSGGGGAGSSTSGSSGSSTTGSSDSTSGGGSATGGASAGGGGGVGGGDGDKGGGKGGNGDKDGNGGKGGNDGKGGNGGKGDSDRGGGGKGNGGKGGGKGGKDD